MQVIDRSHDIQRPAVDVGPHATAQPDEIVHRTTHIAPHGLLEKFVSVTARAQSKRVLVRGKDMFGKVRKFAADIGVFNDRSHCPAVTVPQDDHQRRVQMLDSVLNGTNFMIGADIPCHANHEEIADPCIKDMLDGHARI